MAEVQVVEVSPVPLCPAENKEDDSSSVDTEDAFLDMLGLQKEEEGSPIMVMDEEQVEAEITRRPNNKLVVSPISLPPKCARYHGQHPYSAAVTIPNFCSPEECRSILQLAFRSAAGFQYITEASHVAPDGSTYSVQLQNPNPHKLAVLEHPPTIDLLWKRLVTQTNVHHAPWMKDFQRKTDCGPPRGLNPRLRVLKYDADDNDRFEPHFDATTRVGPLLTSRITVLLYLNNGGGEDFEGGETLFLESHISSQGKSTAREKESTTKIVPRAGTLVLFEHDLYHSGAPLGKGTKHVMRTDILFDTKSSDDETKEEEKKSSKNNESDNDNVLLLVSELCHQHEWSAEEQAVLGDMGLLQSTLESFLSPGRDLLTVLLTEGGIDRLKVDGFLKTAQEQVKAK